MRLWLKIAMVGAMTLAILIPLLSIRGVIADRQRYRTQAVQEIAASVGGAQTIAGPVLVVPYSVLVERETSDKAGVAITVRKRVERKWLYFPQRLEVQGDLLPEKRQRGLHRVRVYQWRGDVRAQFNAVIPPQIDFAAQRIIGQPYLVYGISDVRGLRGTPQLAVNGAKAELAQGGNGRSGLHAPLPWIGPSGALQLQTRLQITLAGTEAFAVLPVGQSNDLQLRSTWPHPSFRGVLPQHRISAEGFQAQWQINALATDAQQRWRSGEEFTAVQPPGLARADMPPVADLAQISLVDPINPYMQADRATKYGVLFVLLTFIGFFMFEIIKRIRVHPIQYALVGLAIAIFFLLLVSLSEHIAFGLAYALAMLACIGLIGFYLSAVLGSRVRGAGFAAMLATLYGALYGLLVMEDNALAVGSGLLFAILAGIMIATRKLDWYALSGEMRSGQTAAAFAPDRDDAVAS